MQKLYLYFGLMEINNKKNWNQSVRFCIHVVLLCNYRYGKFENFKFKFGKSNIHSFRDKLKCSSQEQNNIRTHAFCRTKSRAIGSYTV